jgi:spermidine synthase
MEGLHLTADCFDCGTACQAPLFLNPTHLREQLIALTVTSGLTVVGERFHAFTHSDGSPAGVTGTLLLAESHLAIHTWPERAAVTLDVYVCNFSQDNSDKAHALLAAAIALFVPKSVSRQELHRGIASTSEEREYTLEHLTPDSVYGTRMKQTIAETQSQFQQISVSESAEFGKVMRIDDAMMTSERDEFIYHECLIHPAAMSHQDPRRALIIGGGDGGALEELLKHPSIEHVTLCELDPTVIALSRQHLKSIHHNAFDEDKVRIVHGDGFGYVRNTLAPSEERFDLMFLDLTDPVAPTGSSLAAECMTVEFFNACKTCLQPDGMLVLHLGSPFYHPDRFRETLQKLALPFEVVSPYTTFIPLYGALWGMAIASKSARPSALASDLLELRLRQRRIQDLQYYNIAVHQALFALPNYVKQLCAPVPSPTPSSESQ